MVILTLLTLGNIIFLIYLGIRLLLIDKNSLVHQFLALSMGIVAMMSILELEFSRITYSDELFYLSKVYQSLAISLIFVATLSGYFFVKPLLPKKPMYGLFGWILLAIPFSFMQYHLVFDDFTITTELAKVNGFWAYQSGFDTPLQKCYFYWYLTMIIVLSGLFIVAFKRENTKIKKSWLLLVSVGLTVLPLFLVYFFLFYSQNHYAYFLVAMPMSLCLALMSWSFTNYKLFEINPLSTFDKVMENMNSNVIIVDSKFRIQFVNKLTLDSLEANKKEVLNQPLSLLANSLGIHDLDRLQQQCFALRDNDYFQEDMIVDLNGQKSYMQMNFSPVKNGWDEISGYLILANDLTYHKATEAQLRQQTKELEESNMELERFAYIASHDLKTPLRSIVSFLNLIERRIVKYKDDDLKEFTYLARQGADQMYSLVQDVLEFSRINNKEQHEESVDLNQVVFSITRDLQKTFVEKNAVLQSDHLPFIKGKHTQMKQIFQNLIENGLTYNKEKEPTIKVFYRRQNDQHLFGVKDNGIGIDPKYNEQIFEMFKRLHTTSEYQGSGIGLAICKKIVMAHKGTIWVESKPGQGTTFFFTLSDN